MRICSGKEAASLIEGLISEKHQVKCRNLDLTVAGVSVLRQAGDIDFGGSEEKEALAEQIEPVKRSNEDKYGWWSLTEGEYFVEFNEKGIIPGGNIGFISPLSRTLSAGASHSVLMCQEGEKVGPVLLYVGKAGFNIKENARISALLLMNTGSGK